MDTPNISSILQNHVSLSVSCIDRLYLNGYVPTLQTPGQLCYFLGKHLGHPIVSPALFRPLHDRFVEAIKTFTDREHVPLVAFERGQDKDELAAGYRAGYDQAEGVVFIGVAQERAWSYKAHRELTPPGLVHFDFSRQPVAVNHYYFYLQDPEWGPGFIKVCTYLPHPVRVCLNGHEWVKQQLRRERIAFESLDNGFLSCEDPVRLQAICAALGPDDVQSFFDRWVNRLPWPLTPADRAAGFRHHLSIWQLETSLTQIFDEPVQGYCFEELIRENLDLGRPDRVSLVFPTKITKATPPPAHGYRTRVITDGVNPSLHISYKHSDLKQYFKEGRGLRTELTINNPNDFYSRKGVVHLPYLRGAGEQVNRKLLEVERVSQNCVLTQDALDRLQHPTLEAGGRAPGLRFGDTRVMALLHALCGFAHLPGGFRNRDLRPRMAALLGLDETIYTAGRMTYDLRRLRLKGLIHRIPGTTRYTVTTYGLHVAFFYTKLFLRVLRPGWAALTSDPDTIPHPLRHALLQVDIEIQKLCDDAKLQDVA